MSIGRQLLEELRRDESLREALADELLPEALKRRDLRKSMLLALSREMSTKEDIENLRKSTKEDIENLRKSTKEDIENLRKSTKEDIEKLRMDLKSYIDMRIDGLNKRIDDLYGIVKASLIAIVITLASTILMPLILRIFL
ncbi:MAG: hypothetical protein QXK51_04035 [Candidatus Methanomethylicia archaeon]